MILSIFAFLFVEVVFAKVYDRCELARELKLVHQAPDHQLATWVCIAQHESDFRTHVIGRLSGPNTGDHGIFQISDQYWCSPPGKGRGCALSCSDLTDDDISDDFICAQKIYKEHKKISGDGFTAWAVYSPYCTGGKAAKYLDGCMDGIEFSQPLSFNTSVAAYDYYLPQKQQQDYRKPSYQSGGYKSVTILSSPPTPSTPIIIPPTPNRFSIYHTTTTRPTFSTVSSNRFGFSNPTTVRPGFTTTTTANRYVGYSTPTSTIRPTFSSIVPNRFGFTTTTARPVYSTTTSNRFGFYTPTTTVRPNFSTTTSNRFVGFSNPTKNNFLYSNPSEGTIFSNPIRTVTTTTTTVRPFFHSTTTSQPFQSYVSPSAGSFLSGQRQYFTSSVPASGYLAPSIAPSSYNVGSHNNFVQAAPVNRPVFLINGIGWY